MAKDAKQQSKSQDKPASGKTSDGKPAHPVYHYPIQEEGISGREVKSGYASLAYVESLIKLSCIPVAVYALSTIRTDRFASEAMELVTAMSNWSEAPKVLVAVNILIAMLVVYYFKREKSTYLVDFTAFIPDEKFKVPTDRFHKISSEAGFWNDESLGFMNRVLDNTGLGQETYFPESVLVNPPEINMQRAKEEAEMIMYGAIDDLFKKTGLGAKDIDILIVNCSLFNPTPSLSAMIVNHYKMKTSIETYNLSGMGCSAGVISIGLAQKLLQLHPNSNALVFSTENITENLYPGKEKSMLVQNTLFRMGGAAILLSNKSSYSSTAKYVLKKVVRTHYGHNDMAYNAVMQMEDENGNKGVRLSKDVMKVAGDALKTNITTLAPHILPISEQVKYFISVLRRKVLKHKIPVYVPDFRKAVDHFCIHAAGRAVIDALQENLKLTPYDVEPSRSTLYRFGNTSSSSVWYELNFIENTNRVKKGEKVWQIALGSGFKCNSAVWLRNI
eukprot:GFYU01003707.1.p1 GENE.GFYU01003707.1~~GFYU01003707.1.p1  ORF type:complete len:502 (-),score=162.37 GFYU01003707.1:204-1709(-)